MLSTALDFLLNTVLNLLTLVFLLRFFMQVMRAPFNNPLGLMVISLTDFAVKPMRSIVPSFKKLDLSTLILALITQLLLHLSLIWLRDFPLGLAGQSAWIALFGLSFLGVLKTSIDVFFYALLIQVILSWVNPQSPVSGVLYSLTEPLLAPIRRLLPAVNGLDFSSLVALILIQMINISVLKIFEANLLAMFL